ncbi:MAG: kynureninase [Alphaproteobacteria bacterium]|nr:MAG: kynureninase [Alphaproteobacteria bacterium]
MVTRAEVLALDQADQLAGFRDRFVLDDGLIYLDGNSLGALPKHTAARVADVVSREWGRDLITSWNRNDWIGMPTRIGDKIGRLIGAAPGQVVCSDSTSINVFKLAAAALALRPGRRVVVSDRGNFPTDLYMIQGLAELTGGGVELRLVDETEVSAAITEEVACVMLTEVNYRTGWRHDMAAVTAATHAAGAISLWDLAHSAGAFPVALDAVGADLAVGCGYKYLNGGPGAPAFLYVAQRHQDSIRPPLSGWLGHDAPFAFDLGYRPAAGIQRNVCGTPPVLSMAALECGVDILLEADLDAIRAKSVALADLFHTLVEERLPGTFGIVSPRDAARRGSQVCLTHEAGYAIVQALIAARVIPDFRAPNILRFGLTPLYVRFGDVWDAVDRLVTIMETKTWQQPEFQVRAKVT